MGGPHQGLPRDWEHWRLRPAVFFSFTNLCSGEAVQDVGNVFGGLTRWAAPSRKGPFGSLSALGSSGEPGWQRLRGLDLGLPRRDQRARMLGRLDHHRAEA